MRGGTALGREAALVSRGGQRVLIVLGLILLGFAAGAVVGTLGIEKPWIYVIGAVLAAVVVPLVLRYRSRPRS